MCLILILPMIVFRSSMRHRDWHFFGMLGVDKKAVSYNQSCHVSPVDSIIAVEGDGIHPKVPSAHDPTVAMSRFRWCISGQRLICSPFCAKINRCKSIGHCAVRSAGVMGCCMNTRCVQPRPPNWWDASGTTASPRMEDEFQLVGTLHVVVEPGKYAISYMHVRYA
jgi:hypothetical protein